MAVQSECLRRLVRGGGSEDHALVSAGPEIALAAVRRRPPHLSDRDMQSPSSDRHPGKDWPTMFDSGDGSKAIE